MRTPQATLLYSTLISLMLSVPSVLTAAQDTTEIDISVNEAEYLNLIGTAVGANLFFNESEIEPITGDTGPRPSVSLGTIGFESNIAGNCTLVFSTQHNFRLRHTVTNQMLTNYRLRYRNRNIRRNTNLQFTLPCNLAPTNLAFRSRGTFRRNVPAGVYQDVVTLTLTSQ